MALLAITGGRIDVWTHGPAIASSQRRRAKRAMRRCGLWGAETAELVQMAEDQQIERYEGDPWEEFIGPWVESRRNHRRVDADGQQSRRAVCGP
jgi:hypothetical protein